MVLNRTIVAFAVRSLVSIAGIAAMTVAANPAKEFLPAVQFVGHDSKVNEPRFVLVQDDAAWTSLWAEHTGAEAAGVPPSRHATPKVDFTKFMVVGAFGGDQTNTDGEIVLRILPSDEALRIQYESSTFQTASFAENGDTGVKTTPYGLWIVEKSAKPVIIEEAVRGLKNSPVEWKVVKRFEAS